MTDKKPAFKIGPTEQLIVVREVTLPDDKKRLHIDPNVQGYLRFGEVIEAGPGQSWPGENRRPMTCKEGDIILFPTGVLEGCFHVKASALPLVLDPSDPLMDAFIMDGKDAALVPDQEEIKKAIAAARVRVFDRPSLVLAR